MMTTRTFKQCMLLFMLSLIIVSVDAAKKRPLSDDADDDGVAALVGQAQSGKQDYTPWPIYGGMVNKSRRLMYADELKAAFDIVKRAQAQYNNAASGEKVAAQKFLDHCNQHLQALLKNDDKFGRAIASGFAGKDWEALRDERVENVWEGAKLGALIRLSSACGNVFGKRMENTVEHVVGGSFDTVINAFLDGWNAVREVLFHGGAQPFKEEQIKGWFELSKVSFEDIERQLRDGLKDSMRGADMTLRQPSTNGEEIILQTINPWQLLIMGYIRQFEYIAQQIEKHLEYYDEDDMIVFYGREIKLRLVEFSGLLMQTQSLKSLDTLLDANKQFVPAMRKNIGNLFARLLELVKARAASLGKVNTASTSSIRVDSGRDSNRPLGHFGMDDDYPRPFGG